jgi:hypothetical protein
MTDQEKNFVRWYDKDPVVSKCVKLLEEVDRKKKHQTATFLMDQIISSSPYNQMMPDDIFSLVMEEHRSRRWYDYDDVCKIFMELMRHSSEEIRLEIAIKAITFIEDMGN